MKLLGGPYLEESSRRRRTVERTVLLFGVLSVYAPPQTVFAHGSQRQMPTALRRKANFPQKEQKCLAC